MMRYHMRFSCKLPSRLAVAVAGTTILLWIVSGLWIVAVGDGDAREIRVRGGVLYINWNHRVRGPFEKGYPIGGVKFSYHDDCGGPALAWRPSWVVFPSNGLRAEVPLCIILIPLAAATLAVSCWGRVTPPPGCCRNCGYNLTGNVSGRCPECGIEVARGAGLASGSTRAGAQVHEPGGKMSIDPSDRSTDERRSHE